MKRYFEKATLDEVFNKVTDRFKDKVAIIFEEKHISYTMLKQMSYNIAIKLRQMGIKKTIK